MENRLLQSRLLLQNNYNCFRKKILSCSEQNPASVQLLYRNNRVNNSSRREVVVLQREKVQEKRANKSSEQGWGKYI